MKALFLALLACGLAAGPAAAYEEEGLSEAAVSTDTARGADEDDGQADIQQSDEDLPEFVTDYIRKDVQLKGAFLFEEKASGKVLKLALVSVARAPADGPGGVRKVATVFKDASGRKYDVVFHLQNGPWGGLDIFKIELKPAGNGKPAKN